MYPIIEIDMEIRDERLLKWLEGRHNQRVTAQEMADVFKCHPNTIRAMTKRLKGSGHIDILGYPSVPGGYTYRVKSLESCNDK